MPKPEKFDPDLVMVLGRMSGDTLRTLHRIAKDPKKGLRPFFRDPKAMIALRRLKDAKD